VIAAMSLAAVGAGFLFPQRRLEQGNTPTPRPVATE
jgi:hypothetical protein